jgi:hypothetical protein
VQRLSHCIEGSNYGDGRVAIAFDRAAATAMHATLLSSTVFDEIDVEI